jgi:Uma2 family endonuclease
MMIVAAKRTWTDRELLEMPHDGIKREIICGELVMSPASSVHGAIIMRISGPLFAAAVKSGLGEMLDGQTGCRMRSGDVICPDISYVSLARWKAHREQKTPFFAGGPDLIVEVLSPDDTMGRIEEKLEQCFAEGTKLAWIVHPRLRRVHVYRALGSDTTVKEGQVLTGDDVVPGLELPVSAVFPV